MNTHLDEQHISAAVAGLELEPETRKHLASCLSCRHQVAAFKDLIDARSEQMVAGMPDWDRQRAEILLRLRKASTSQWSKALRWVRPLLAAAAVVIVAVGLEIMWSPAPAGDPISDLEVPIEQILADVDAVLADQSLPGFESIDPGVDDLESYFENGAS